VRRRLVLLSSLIAVLVAPPAVAGAPGAPDATVRAAAPDEGQTVLRSGVRVGQTRSDTVDSTNLAEAYAHDCTGCEAVAASLQSVVAIGSPATVAPTNAAVAVNQSCTGCKVFAYAYQYVVTTDRPFRLDGVEARTVRDVRREADALVHQGLPYPDLDARLHDLAGRFRAAIDAEIAQDGARGHGESRERIDDVG
jgi:hypothetical protein